jgi:hypothetical protein
MIGVRDVFRPDDCATIGTSTELTVAEVPYKQNSR